MKNAGETQQGRRRRKLRNSPFLREYLRQKDRIWTVLWKAIIAPKEQFLFL